MKHERIEYIGEAVKTVVIFLLIVLMLVLMILLMLGQNTAAGEALPPEERMVVYASGAQTAYARGMQTARVLPELLAFRTGGTALSALTASDSMKKTYAALYTPLRTLLGADSHCTMLSAETGTTVWANCTALEDLIYIRYQGTLPSAVIRMYTFAEEESDGQTISLDETASGAAAYIHELFLVPAETFFDAMPELGTAADAVEICAVARDDAGTVYLFQAQNTTAEHDDTQPMMYAANNTAVMPAQVSATDTEEEPAQPLAAYIETVDAFASDAKDAAFSTSEETFCMTSADSTAVWLYGNYCMPVLTVMPYSLDEALFAGEETADFAKEVLSLLGMREEDAESYYTDTQGDRVYINADGRLAFRHDSSIQYTALQDGGLPVTDYLGYASVSGSYLLSEYLRAADRLLSGLSALDASLTGGAMACTLFGVGTVTLEDGSEGVHIVYIYTVNGIPVLDEEGCPIQALVLTAADGAIKTLTLHTITAQKTEEQLYLLPQAVVLAALRQEQTQMPESNRAAEGVDADVVQPVSVIQNGSLSMRYVLDAEDKTSAAAEWIFYQEES